VARAPFEVRVFDAAIEDSAVDRAPDLPLELELEVAEFVLGNQIADMSVLGQRATFDLPALRHRRHLVAAPRAERLSIEQRLPRPASGCVRVRNEERKGTADGGGSNAHARNYPTFATADLRVTTAAI